MTEENFSISQKESSGEISGVTREGRAQMQGAANLEAALCQFFFLRTAIQSQNFTLKKISFLSDQINKVFCHFRFLIKSVPNSRAGLAL